MKTRRWWNLRTKSLAWMAVGVFLPLAYLAWHIFGWPAPIRVSYETTRLTSPLTPDGYVDYLSVFRKNLQMGDDDIRHDPWFALFENERDATRSPNDPARNRPHPLGTENIVYRDPVAALTASLRDENSSIEKYQKIYEFQNAALRGGMRIPVSVAEDPLLAAIIDENKAWYDAVLTTYQQTPLPVQFQESTSPRMGQILRFVLLPIHQDCAELARRFRLRSMYRADQKDLNGALDDMEFNWKIAARLDNCCIVSTLSATAIELHATPAIITQILTADRLTPEYCSRIEKLPQDSTIPAFLTQLDEAERYMGLDDVQGLYATRCDGYSLFELAGIKITGPLAGLKSRRIWHAVNWNQICLKQNQNFDAIVAALRLPTWHEQNHAMEIVRNDPAFASVNFSSEIDSAQPWSVTDPTHLLAHSIPGLWVRAGDYMELAHLRDLRRRVVQIVARLAMWRQVHGEFPDDLQSILTVEGFSVASPTLLVDPFNDHELGYEKQTNGFMLYSVGPNMQKDGSGFEECSIHETDFSDRSRPDDDHIWRWPLAE